MSLAIRSLATMFLTIVPRDKFYNRLKHKKTKNYNSNKRFALFTWSSLIILIIITDHFKSFLFGIVHHPLVLSDNHDAICVVVPDVDQVEMVLVLVQPLVGDRR